METTKENGTFYLSLCMAGAVSAGAYTAGVLDYLLEALDHWEKMKKSEEKDVPTHKIVIPVAGEASGAFPVGLRARRVTRHGLYVNQLNWLKDVTKLNPINDGEYESYDKFCSTVVMIDTFPASENR